MGEIADYMIGRMIDGRPGDYWGDDDIDDEGVTCNRCGKDNLYWQKIFSADGERSVLFDAKTSKQHVCTVSTSGMTPE